MKAAKMRYLSLILSAVVLTGCSAAGLGSPHTNSCAPHCMPYTANSYGAPIYSQPVNTQAYGQSHYNQASYYPAGYGTYPSQQSYGTHAQVQMPQLRGPYDPYSDQGYKYGALGVILYDFDSEKFGVQGRIGYQSDSIFGAELEGSLGLGGDTEDFVTDGLTSGVGATSATTTTTPPSSTLTTEYTNSIAAFGLARLPISDRLSIHGRAGLHSTRFKAELDDGTQILTQNETSTGIAYGLGMEYALTTHNDIRLDYTVYEADFGGNADSLSIAFAQKF